MDLYFDTPLSPLPSILLLLTTQCIGFGLAGKEKSDMISITDFPSRNVTKPTSQSAYHVLALNPRHCSALHHPVFDNIIHSITHPATTYLYETSRLLSHLSCHISLSISPVLILPDIDQRVTAVPCQQPFMVDADAG